MNIIKNYIRNKIADLIEWAIGAQIDSIRESIRRNGCRVTTLQQDRAINRCNKKHRYEKEQLKTKSRTLW